MSRFASLAPPLTSACLVVTLTGALAAQERPRARALGIPFDGVPGPLNAITDVGDVAVGHTTLIQGEGSLVGGLGPVRTGVTAILPRGPGAHDPVFGAYYSLNGNGEMTGAAWIEESGLVEGPILITNTHSVGLVRDAVIDWLVRNRPGFRWALPVVAETYDGVLNDINGFHVRPEHVFAALDSASRGPVQEGGVGGGTGMICHGFKGGIGMSSRRLPAAAGGYTVGVLVQCNYGARRALRIAGVPVGEEVRGHSLCYEADEELAQPPARGIRRCDHPPDAGPERMNPELGSIIIVVATDAPLLPHQLSRLVKRTTLGLGRVGSIASNFSGDLFVAFSTANTGLGGSGDPVLLTMLPNDRLDPLFLAAIQATEEAITNALIVAETMTGIDGVRVHGLPHDQVRDALTKYNRLQPGGGR
ncbi:MAG TPA: P1 family peptidase [Longimicrobiaceae bacterium]|nr:P1 family peptidase [Longimicrobiaceae bacterium]